MTFKVQSVHLLPHPPPGHGSQLCVRVPVTQVLILDSVDRYIFLSNSPKDDARGGDRSGYLSRMTDALYWAAGEGKQ